MKKLLLLLFISILSFSWTTPGKKTPAIYQLTVYQYKDSAQEALLDQYLGKALLPALHQLKYEKVGVFKSRANDTAAIKKLYVLVAGKTMDEFARLYDRLQTNADYLQNGKAYLDAPNDKPPYSRMETIFLKAFSLAPSLELPALKGPKADRVYELRSYESATEKIYRNKVQMFNEGGEIALFKRLNFNAVFYSEVIAGSKMPNLMYMTCFENMADRDAHWKTFGSDPEWKRLSAMPEYQHNVSVNEKNFLYPTGYSDY
jgi:NIPSNAP